jgi:exodeoxyribonuclease V alpha subunit
MPPALLERENYMTVFENSEKQQQEQIAAIRITMGLDKKKMALLNPFIQRLELSALDYMTIRDLVVIGGCRGDVPLIAVLMVMFAGLREGSLCLALDNKHFLEYLSADDRGNAADFLADFLEGLAAGRYEKLVTQNGADYLPLIMDTAGGRQLLYFQKYHVHEKRLKDRIEAYLAAAVSLPLPDETIDARIDDLYAEQGAIRVGADNHPIARDARQVDAIRMALRNQFAIISGSPGTGKTSLLVNILRCLLQEGLAAEQIILGAPTGRAAQRMTETIQSNAASIAAPAPEDAALLELQGSTLHKLLGYRRRSHSFYYRETNPLPAAVVVIDEVSMVDVVMLDKFLQALDPARTKLILLGDKNQLPSVEAGAVFAEMIPDGSRAAVFKDRFVVLEKVYRSGTHLLELAAQVNQGAFPAFQAVGFESAVSQKPDQWAFVNAESYQAWQQHLRRWTTHHYLDPAFAGEGSYADLVQQAGTLSADDLAATDAGDVLLGRLFAVVERARILSFLRNGIYGCTIINAVIAGQLRLVCDPLAARQADGFSGAIIIITRNDYAKGLFNGDVGIILKDERASYRAFFHRSGEYISFPVNLLPAWEYAFAMTVHKSQGSEYDDVLLVLPDDETHRMLSIEIVYTGITRAKKRVVLYGTQGALKTALQRKIQRRSGFMW